MAVEHMQVSEYKPLKHERMIWSAVRRFLKKCRSSDEAVTKAGQ